MHMKKPGRSSASTEPGGVSFDCGSNAAEPKTETTNAQARPDERDARLTDHDCHRFEGST
jgi:hypothetical protein